MREKEKERVYEKKLLKERTEEDKEFGDKPKFMTTAYKKKLLEDQKWEYEDRYAICIFSQFSLQLQLQLLLLLLLLLLHFVLLNL